LKYRMYVEIREARWIKQSQGGREEDETPKCTRETTARGLFPLRRLVALVYLPSYLETPVAYVSVCGR
jgi:hypothetical protein